MGEPVGPFKTDAELVAYGDGYNDGVRAALQHCGLGVIADRGAAEAVVGRPLPEELFQLNLWWRLILVVREPAERKIGSIVIPDRNQQAKSAGWVIAAGPMVGAPDPATGRTSPFNPAELLLKRVFFMRYAGTAIPVLAQDEEGRWEIPKADYDADYVLMTDLDILAHF